MLNAASSKWNFINFEPGLVGGHCIGVDPYYLTHKSIELGYTPEMILAGRKINENMSQHIVKSIIKRLKNISLNPRDARVAVLGVTFKENCPDIRNSKVFKLIDYLKKERCDVIVNDPWVDENELQNSSKLQVVKMDKIKNVDVIVLAVSHDEYKGIKADEWKNMFNSNGIFIDIKSVYKQDFFQK